METWRLVRITGKKGFYGYVEVNRNGVVKSKHGNVLKPIEDQDGYYRVMFTFKIGDKKCSYYRFVHRLVAMAFISNTYDKPQVNHIDSDRKNNNVENLEWVTAKENVEHSIKYGKNNPKGENNSNAKLKQYQVDNIRKKWNTKKYKVNHLAKEYNVSWTLIKMIVTNKIWKD